MEPQERSLLALKPLDPRWLERAEHLNATGFSFGSVVVCQTQDVGVKGERLRRLNPEGDVGSGQRSRHEFPLPTQVVQSGDDFRWKATSALDPFHKTESIGDRIGARWKKGMSFHSRLPRFHIEAQSERRIGWAGQTGRV